MQIRRNSGKLIYPELSYKINGILFSVHNELGQYCNEKQYGDLIEEYLRNHEIRYEREKVLPSSFSGETPGRNKVDFLIENLVILETKAKRIVSGEEYYQVKRYLVALNKKLGILVNFRRKYITPKRVLNALVRD